MQRWMSTDNVSSFVNGVCMYGLVVVDALWRPTRILLEFVCEACSIRLGSQVWRHVDCASTVGALNLRHKINNSFYK